MTTITPTTVKELLNYWSENIPFKGGFVSDDGCMCPHGQALHFLDNYSLSDLRNIDQATADKRVAELFGISQSHSALLRIVNDRQDGAPSCVIRNPKQILGNQAQIILALWRHFDCMTATDWAAAVTVAETDAWVDAWVAAGLDARIAVGFDAWVAARLATESRAQLIAAQQAAYAAAGTDSWVDAELAVRLATGASNEIQGAAIMRAKNQPFFFLPLFGFLNPEAVIAADSD